MDPERGYGARGGEDQGQIMGCRGKGLADHIWQKALAGDYQSFSIGGRGVRVSRVRFG